MNQAIVAPLGICVDHYLPGEKFDPASQPSPTEMRSASRQELALDKYKLWQPGQVLRMRFLDGEPGIWKIVEDSACQWLKYANLQFEFGNFPDADIRITFQGSGYRSLVGRDAYKAQDPDWTMQLGGLTKDSDPLEIQRVVLHEFGHAIGCVHEQASPVAHIPWDMDKVYPYYLYYYGWDKEMVDTNILLRYTSAQVYSTAVHDPSSIMQYPVPKELTLDGFEIGWNRELSEMDKAFISKLYPR